MTAFVAFFSEHRGTGGTERKKEKIDREEVVGIVSETILLVCCIFITLFIANQQCSESV